MNLIRKRRHGSTISRRGQLHHVASNYEIQERCHIESRHHNQIRHIEVKQVNQQMQRTD
jgi:hypothetical protein